jgi:hypothetical protein
MKPGALAPDQARQESKPAERATANWNFLFKRNVCQPLRGLLVTFRFEVVLCVSVDLRVSVVKFPAKTFTTVAQRIHRDTES